MIIPDRGGGGVGGGQKAEFSKDRNLLEFSKGWGIQIKILLWSMYSVWIFSGKTYCI